MHFKTVDSLTLPEATERTAAMGVPKSATALCGYKLYGKTSFDMQNKNSYTDM
jgi:hypothetical protein